MRTYLVVWFSSEGKPVSEVTSRVMSMGFKPMSGNYDYVYEWGSTAGLDDVLSIGEQLQETLRGCDVSFKLETV